MDCFRNKPKDQIKKAEDGFEHSVFFQASENITCQDGILVDTGCTSHVVNDREKFSSFDATFKSLNHTIELADGSVAKGVAVKRGHAHINLIDENNEKVETVLKNALYIPTYPHNIMSVRAATTTGARVTLSKEENTITNAGRTFKMSIIDNLYYLPTTSAPREVDKLSLVKDLQYWHRVLGHCNFDDVLKLEKVVDGMEIKGSKVKETCNICTEE
ncbi:uncharacterized protein [Antedon mediterranea]|uniref:uncharacterized protein n=2 Tax=Antedon mediterranea TaxID=105859 RepID=UPI003AF63E7D